MAPWLILLIVWAGVLALAGVFYAIARIRTRMTRHWVRTVGVVVRRRTGGTGGGMPAAYPTFQWQDTNGQVHQHTSSVRQSFGPAPGKRVPVLYDPEKPSRGAIDSWVQSGRVFYTVAALIAAIGSSIVLPLLAVFLWRSFGQ